MTDTKKYPGQIVATDRTGWEPGPWDDEADRVDWWTPQGYPGLVLRNDFGSLCGYVAVPPKHPCYGVRYDAEPVGSLLVHGGVTYSNRGSQAICRVMPREEIENDWWIGFDTAHAFDPLPRDASEDSYSSGVARQTQTRPVRFGLRILRLPHHRVRHKGMREFGSSIESS